MKTKQLLLFSFATVLATGCSDDTFVSDNRMDSVEGLNGKLVETGLLGVGRDGTTAETRAYAPSGRFVWMPTELADDGKLTDARKNQKIGLCWTGRDLVESYGATDVLSEKVYTNYMFEHVGWMDLKAEAVKTDVCDGTLKNGGYIIGEGKVTGDPEASFEGNWTGGDAASTNTSASARWNEYYYGENENESGQMVTVGQRATEQALDLTKGIFSTANASIFQGEYIAYYPYTSRFTKGQILAAVPDTFSIDQADDRYAASSDYAFSVGYIQNYKGGNAAERLKAVPVTGFLGVKLAYYGENVNTTDSMYIKKVIFYSESKNILYEQDLSAAAIADSYPAFGDGTGLYYANGNKAYTNSVVARLSGTGSQNGEKRNYYTVAGVTASTVENKVDDYAWVVVPALPQTIDDLKVILIDKDDKSCTIEPGGKQIQPNQPCFTVINLASYKDSFKSEYLVDDELSLVSALNTIYNKGDQGTNADANVIKLLRDVKVTFDAENTELAAALGDNKNHTMFYNRNITIEGVGKLIVASDTYAQIKTSNTSRVENSGTPVLTINVDVEIEGAGCCGTEVGKLMIGGATKAASRNTVIINGDVTNCGELALGHNGTKNKTDVTINGTLTNTVDQWGKDNAHAATVYLCGAQKADNGVNHFDIKTVINEGKICAWPKTVFSADETTGKLERESLSDLNLAKGQTARIVETTIQTLTNGTANDNGDVDGVIEIERGTMITVKTALTNSTANSLIKTAGDGKADTDGRLDVMGTSSNEGTIDNNGVINFGGSNLDNNGLFIDRISGQVGGKWINNGTRASENETVKNYAGEAENVYTTDLKVEGIYVSQVETTARLAKVLKDEVIAPSTVIVEILGCEATGGVYNLSDDKYKGKDLANYDLRINEQTNGQICFKAYTKVDGEYVFDDKPIAHCAEIVKGTLLLKDGTLSTVKSVKVMAGTNFKTAQTEGYKNQYTVGTNLIVEGTATHNADLLSVGQDLTVKTTDSKNSKFESNGTFAVGRNVVVETDATFDSNGDNNTVGNNFTTYGNTTFASGTTTRVENEFNLAGGTFAREATSGNDDRATVNVGTLDWTGGTTNTGTPTERQNNE